MNLRKLMVIGWALAVLLPATVARSEVALPAIIGSHMVLQRDIPLPIWGWADPGEEVVVTIDNQKHGTKADAEGRWNVTLEPLAVGDPRSMTVAGKNTITLTDILVGEVWVCSGQSNMQWSVRQSWNADLEIASADHPQIRLMTVATPGMQIPLEDFTGTWQVCSPSTIADFSAVGYFFGRQLQEVLDVPIGLIDNAWGGSACEAWVSRDRLNDSELYGPLMKRWQETEAKPELKSSYEEFEKARLEWLGRAIAARKAGESIPAPPTPPRNNMVTNHRPGNLYNGRLQPVIPFGIRGAIWYQGEANTSRAYQYRELFPLMIQNWRDEWRQGDFPFYWVQLADFKEEKANPGDSDWAELREAQTWTQDRLPNTGQAVIIDIGEASDIHPRNKLEVAKRLARLALVNDYGRDFASDSPRYKSMSVRDGKAELVFGDVGTGLRTVDKREAQGFVISGPDHQWHWANAKIEGKDKIVVWSDEVTEPVAVRYAWADNPVCNVYSKEGLPLTPFRTDDWPGVTADKR